MLGLYLIGKGGVPIAAGEVLPGGSLDPAGIKKFASPLLIPPVPRTCRMVSRGRDVDCYVSR